MRIVISALIWFVLLSNTTFASVTTKIKKLTIGEIKTSSITAVRAMYNKKKNTTLRVGRKKGYASCELYEKQQKGTCTVQFPGSQEVITKCKLAKVRGRNTTSCHVTNLLFFFPNSKL